VGSRIGETTFAWIERLLSVFIIRNGGGRTVTLAGAIP
jgi:hypothetical protein